MAVTKQEKQEILKGLEDQFARAKGIVFAQNKGMTVKSISKLRRTLLKEHVDYKVAKKTLMKRAAEKAGVPNWDVKVLEGSVAAAFSYEDEVTPAKLIKQFMKEDEKLEIVGGILEGKLIDAATVKTLAALPSKLELLTKVAISLKSPLSSMANVLAGPLRKMVYVLQDLSKKKGTA